ncbi:MAG: WecB/TagA/CpsF family glycosyltransferase [Firmicutes bacterium]|nr:WecB/TagA/CpsF family glycosyltransferase [Bacillota bacterium]MBR0179038.1 WecB/TagA/CpsF family glycosyltransferase [Bacillota bacterium]
MIRILGVRVDEYDMQQSLDLIGAFVAQSGDELKQVVTINPEGVWLAQGDGELKRIIDDAALVTPDGNGVLWAARQLGTPIKERVAGIELLENICRRGAEEGWRIYLLGAKPGVADVAAQKLQEKYPGLQIVGCDNGYFRDREEQAVSCVREAKADVLFAALGMPYQEHWLYDHRRELGCKVAVGVGGSFDVLAGLVRRAPALWQRLKLEWLWRLLSDPKRWRRYLVIPRYMRAVKKQARQN